MPGPFIQPSTQAKQAALKRGSEALPHGLITPPPEAFAGAEQGRLNQWTLDYYFDEQTADVLYRETPEGPEVLAVGFDEIFARTNAMDPEAMRGLKTWTS